MVARRGSPGHVGSSMGRMPHPRATIKAHHPSTQPPSPLRRLMLDRPKTQMNRIPRPSVGADLSRTSPIYRPPLTTHYHNEIVHLQYLRTRASERIFYGLS